MDTKQPTNKTDNSDKAKQATTSYKFKPKNKAELQDLLIKLIAERGTDGDFNDIDTSLITDFNRLFYNNANTGSGEDTTTLRSFNGDISKWNVSNVTDFSVMFYMTSFNRDISKWDVSSGTNFDAMFYAVKSFNQDLSNWQIAENATTNNMFKNATAMQEENKPNFRDCQVNCVN